MNHITSAIVCSSRKVLKFVCGLLYLFGFSLAVIYRLPGVSTRKPSELKSIRINDVGWIYISHWQSNLMTATFAIAIAASVGWVVMFTLGNYISGRAKGSS